MHDSRNDLRVDRLETLFSHYDPGDVCVSIGISELWLPNSSSQVKHCLAFSVFASTVPDRFAQREPIDTYELFEKFVLEMYNLLPSFSTLEDYIPEFDWGEVKAELEGQFLRLFYGCSIERIPDFVEAFRLSNGTVTAALHDMHVALSLQDCVISQVDRTAVGSADGIRPGHVELPSPAFWQQCRAALKSVSSRILGMRPSAPLLLSQGAFKCPRTSLAFGNSLFDGTSLPAILVQVDGALLPLSPRNALGAVIDRWAAARRATGGRGDDGLTAPVARFIRLRFDDHDALCGPLTLFDQTGVLPYQFAAVTISR